MKTSYLAVIAIFICCACSNESGKDGAVQPQPDSVVTSAQESPDSTGEYLPVLSILRGDLKEVDTYGAAIVLKTKYGSKTDSSYIKLPELKTLAENFLSPDLEAATFARQFKESSMIDQASASTTFIYTSEATESTVRKVIVYVSPGQALDKVSRIYLEKQINRGDTLITQRLTWKLKEYFIIAENKEAPGNFQSTLIRKAIWEPALFAEEF